ncbi:MAG: hypothetical protein Q4D94_11035 [Bacillota bacterium]|nr:hypothetical protein [Bacillota bacterium]
MEVIRAEETEKSFSSLELPEGKELIRVKKDDIFHLRKKQKNKLRVKKLDVEEKLCKDRNNPYKGLANFAGGGIEGD